ncbi:hypothetical protein RYA05_06320 [Pseudomonas syringae pv. actinidiae]|nr:hypothetical protein [Pseudomonas syringae pv. actinidiae]
MTIESPLKQLLMGNLDILKADDPALIEDLLAKFQGVAIRDNAATGMVYVRACYSNSVNIVNAMLSNDMIKDPDCYEQAALKAAIKNDNPKMIEILTERGCNISSPGQPWLVEASIKGASSCIPAIIAAIQKKEGTLENLRPILDACTVHLAKNEMKISAREVNDGLEHLIKAGASGSGTKENLLSSAVLAHRFTDMSSVVQGLLDRGASEASIRVSKSALAVLISDIKSSNFTTPHLTTFDPIAHFRSVREKIEGYRGRVAAVDLNATVG